VAYTPDWESIADALKRVIATGVGENEAKSYLCGAAADGKIDVRVTITGTGQVFSDGNVRVPPHLKPKDLDWVHSRPVAQWLVGPRPGQHYTWNWSERPIALVELSTVDVSRVLCGAVNRDADQQTNATHALGSHLRANPNLTREQAVKWCENQGFTLSGRSFQNQVWPSAREEAGLPRRAPPGRKNNSSR
jgi:hypothetical protein